MEVSREPRVAAACLRLREVTGQLGGQRARRESCVEAVFWAGFLLRVWGPRGRWLKALFPRLRTKQTKKIGFGKWPQSLWLVWPSIGSPI